MQSPDCPAAHPWVTSLTDRPVPVKSYPVLPCWQVTFFLRGTLIPKLSPVTVMVGAAASDPEITTEVISGGAGSIVMSSFCLFDPRLLVAVRLTASFVAFATAGGVPDSLASPLPVGVRVNHNGRLATVIVEYGYPLVVTEIDSGVSAMVVTCEADVNAGLAIGGMTKVNSSAGSEISLCENTPDGASPLVTTTTSVVRFPMAHVLVWSAASPGLVRVMEVPEGSTVKSDAPTDVDVVPGSARCSRCPRSRPPRRRRSRFP